MAGTVLTIVATANGDGTTTVTATSNPAFTNLSTQSYTAPSLTALTDYCRGLFQVVLGAMPS
jgi:hypothetical protein